jgi:RNA polymerase sigma-70 factor (ECF subfamily)
MQTTHSELVPLCLKGDQSAWAQLVEEYRGLVYSICLPFSASQQDAEDLVQDTFVKIWNNLGSYDPARGELKSWISTVARNQRVDRFRRNSQQRRTHSLDEGWDQSDAVAMADRLADQRPTPQEAATTSQVIEMVTRAVEQVAPEMREVVKLRFLFEMDNQEIAHRLRIPEGTVKSRTSRGRAQLATLLSPMRAALGAA